LTRWCEDCAPTGEARVERRFLGRSGDETLLQSYPLSGVQRICDKASEWLVGGDGLEPPTFCV
jgi:hypothetical protein